MNQSLLPELKKTLLGANRADFCVGYINLRSWKTLEVVEHDATQKLEAWFEERWTDNRCLDISQEGDRLFKFQEIAIAACFVLYHYV
ncbi:MAG: hypothetical protein ACRC6M_00640 [Microcystaceae cyanobacterium]